MIPAKRILTLAGTHLFALAAGLGLGIYLLPIVTAPDGPSAELLRTSAATAQFTGQFRRDVEDSDLFHWGDGTLYVSDTNIVLEGRLAPGPDYRLYLSPQFVETEADFTALKSSMAHVGHVRTFRNFAVRVPENINPAQFNTAIVWCESFGQFITSAQYR